MYTIPVLLIDHNPAFLRITTRLLREYYQAEIEVHSLSPAEPDFMQKAQEFNPRIVLLGIGQDSMQGLKIIPQIRAALPDVGIIVLGLLNINLYREASLRAGADAFVAKVDLNTELLTTIWRIIGRSPDAPSSRSDNTNGNGRRDDCDETSNRQVGA